LSQAGALWFVCPALGVEHVRNDAKIRPSLSAPAPEDVESDEQLVEAAAGGRREAFETLVRRHQRALVNHIRRLVGQGDVARDLAQEVFLKVYLSLTHFDPRYRFTTWLYRIATNSAIDHRRRRTIPTRSLQSDTTSSQAPGPAGSITSASPSPHDVLRMRETQARLEHAVRELPSDYRQLILLRHRLHCRYDEIARITRLPLGTVKNRIFRARELLRRDLADLLDTEVRHG